MNQIKAFIYERNDIRTLLHKGEPFFIAKDVAVALGYKDTNDAIRRHVDHDDKLTWGITDSGQLRQMYIINESGLYSLILSSRLESSKKFKRWVTSELLPQIRKTGKYEIQELQHPISSMEILKLQVQALEETNNTVSKVQSDVKYLKEEVQLGAGEYGMISRRVQKTVMQTITEYGYSNTPKVKEELFKDINNGLNKICGIRTRTQLKKKHFEQVIRYLNLWKPRTSTQFIINELMQEDKEYAN
ncbi:MAG TPA: ORF6C domain-containing protein [Candidatus Jeotgalibaca merdavium]|uniref:ORF6C domain-containing protein n=1 Tax=Candidatus Jeotgalibaca merdavium TaxID=2838627 RepID=A0A9D2KY66_9LACT|nr:ORF6C domain-containing protein [Candidatus Jeotgalibaca merdavium]